jgi:hypothetical protein
MRRHIWLLAALAALVLGAMLFHQPDKALPTRKAERDFPSYYREKDHERRQKRRTFIPRSVEQSNLSESEKSQSARDPLLAALPPDADVAMVFEAGTFFSLPLGQVLLECLGDEGPTLEKEGFSMQSIERIAMASIGDERVMMMSGDFSKLPGSTQWKDLKSEPVGEKGRRFFEKSYGDAGAPQTKGALWGDELLVMNESGAAFDKLVARLESPNELASSPLEELAYGEMYGKLSPAAAQKLLSRDLSDDLSIGDTRFEIHVDASETVNLVVDAFGPDERSTDLGRAIATAVAAKRVAALATGDDETAELLDEFVVNLHPNGFQAQLVFPQKMIDEMLSHCKNRRAKPDPQPKPPATP